MIPSIIIIWLILPIHILIFNTANNNSCMYLDAPAALYNSIYGISFVGFIPPFLMFLFSFLTFRNLKLRQQQRQVRQFSQVNTDLSTNRNRKQQKRNQQALGLLMIQVVVYVSTTTITSINLLYSVLTTYMGINKSDQRKSIETFITFITGMLNYACPCLSFYLFLLVSHLYRKQMKLVILHIIRLCYFPWARSNNNVGERTPVRQMTARVKPIEQPVTIPLSIIANYD
jgi:CRISPR/Cas system CSM-associated protein Csm2 small subunit